MILENKHKTIVNNIYIFQSQKKMDNNIFEVMKH